MFGSCVPNIHPDYCSRNVEHEILHPLGNCELPESSGKPWIAGPLDNSVAHQYSFRASPARFSSIPWDAVHIEKENPLSTRRMQITYLETFNRVSALLRV